MNNILYRIWDTQSKTYIDDSQYKLENVISFNIIDNYICVNQKEGFVYERCALYLQDLDAHLFEGDVVYAYDIFDELVNYYNIIYENGVFYGSNNDEINILSDIVKTYNIQIIGSMLEMNTKNMRIYKNVCTECMNQNIIIQPNETQQFYCMSCGSVY